MLARKLQFQFDFGSPNAYLAARRFRTSNDGPGPIRLCAGALGGIYKLTASSPPIISRRKETSPTIWRWRRALHQASRHLHLRRNPFFPVNTWQLMRGAVAAEAEGVFWPYFQAVDHHMWEEPKKMDDPGGRAKRSPRRGSMPTRSSPGRRIRPSRIG